MLFSVCIGEFQGPAVTLLNIGTNEAPYSYWSNPDNVIGFNTLTVLADYRKEASWWKIYNDDKTFSFRDLKHGYCIQYYDRDGRVIQNPCDYSNPNMKFFLEVTTTGRHLLRFKSNEHCLYATTEYVYGGPCEFDNANYHWAMIPAIYRP